MELSGLKDTQPYYGVLATTEGRVMGCLYYQLKLFKASESIQYDVQRSLGLKQFRQKLKRKLASRIMFRTLVQGNLSVSGPFGHWFDDELEDDSEILFRLAMATFRMLQSDHKDLKAILLKDYYRALNNEDDAYAEFRIQPAMEMVLEPQWSSFGDYTKALRSKYRVRFRKARERLMGIEKKYLKASEISNTDLSRIHQLYTERADSSDFNIATLQNDYFRHLKENLTDQCSFWMYYLGKELVAYMCILKDGSTVHAHFTGYEESMNREHDLYLNLLYDVIGSAIEMRASRICFARTAMEIKSAVGADPRELYCYMYYDSTVSQYLIPSIVKYLEPKKEWNNRQPFKN